jgi:tetratricopeptide (TPR) repeat protein
VHDALGDKAQALAYYEQALPLQRQVGDKGGEAITCYNMAGIYARSGYLEEAERLLMRTVELDEATSHPDLASDRATLEQVRRMLQGRSQPAGGPGPGEERQGP